MQDTGPSKVTQLEDALAVARMNAEIAETRLKAENAKLKTSIVKLEALAAKMEVEAHTLHSQVQLMQGNVRRLNQWRDLELRRQAGDTALDLQDGFNGQLSKAEMFHEIVAKRPMRVALQSAAFRGQTTRYLAGRFRHVVAFGDEIHDLEQAQKHCAVQPNISFGYGDSRKMDEAWVNIPIPLDEVDFAYLDARVFRLCSLREELTFALSALPNAIIFIDDIKIDDDPDYSYEIFPPIVQDLDFIKDILKANNPLCFFPARRGVDDTSLYYEQAAPSGTLVVIPRALESVTQGAKTIRPIKL